MDFYWLSLLHSEHVLLPGSPGGGEDRPEGVSRRRCLTAKRKSTFTDFGLKPPVKQTTPW